MLSNVKDMVKARMVGNLKRGFKKKIKAYNPEDKMNLHENFIDLDPVWAAGRKERIKKKAAKVIKKFGIVISKQVDEKDHEIFTDFVKGGGSLELDKLSGLKESKKNIYYNVMWEKTT